MNVVRAEFRAAAATPGQIPPPFAPEVALAGRSNVGKSSLVNLLTGRRKLARTSQTPGCTRGLIFYSIDERLALVDLPGYGWAKRSKEERGGWKALIEYYLQTRDSLAGVLSLIDVRRGPGDDERALAAYLDASGIPRAWVLTKCDKLGRNKLEARLRELGPELRGAAALATSAVSKMGIDDVWRWISTTVDRRDAADRRGG